MATWLPLVIITHGMSLVQKMKGNYQTFCQLADSALTHILLEGVMSHRIDMVFADISNEHEP